jgi:hypothetical protein
VSVGDRRGRLRGPAQRTRVDAGQRHVRQRFGGLLRLPPSFLIEVAG